MGVIGLCSGIIGGRLIISFGYPLLIGRFLGVPLSSQLKLLFRPVLVTILLFSIAIGLDWFVPVTTGEGIKGWLFFILFAGATGILMLLISFYAGLSGDQRRNMIHRIRTVLLTAKSQ
jgi:hypothetical protein